MRERGDPFALKSSLAGLDRVSAAPMLAAPEE
jgi:hypothetical protein